MATTKRRPKTGGVKHWFDLYAPLGAPTDAAWVQQMQDSCQLVQRASKLLGDPEAGMWIPLAVAQAYGEQESNAQARRLLTLAVLESFSPDGFVPDEMLDVEVQEDSPLDAEMLPELLNAPELSPVGASDILSACAMSEGHFLLEDEDKMPLGIALGVAYDVLSTAPDPGKPRLVNVSKPLAELYIKNVHSALPEYNYRGLLYAIGLAVRSNLLAVATATTPTGQFGDLDVDQILELSRIASIGTKEGGYKGASSMLCAHLMDLLPISGRMGKPGLLFITYSLVKEEGTSYLALTGKGLRPTQLNRGKKGGGGGSRKGAGNKALPEFDKVRWDYGPKALPPNWDVLREAAELGGILKTTEDRERLEKRIAGARKVFETQYLPREAKHHARLLEQAAGTPKMPSTWTGLDLC